MPACTGQGHQVGALLHTSKEATSPAPHQRLKGRDPPPSLWTQPGLHQHPPGAHPESCGGFSQWWGSLPSVTPGRGSMSSPHRFSPYWELCWGVKKPPCWAAFSSLASQPESSCGQAQVCLARALLFNLATSSPSPKFPVQQKVTLETHAATAGCSWGKQHPLLCMGGGVWPSPQQDLSWKVGGDLPGWGTPFLQLQPAVAVQVPCTVFHHSENSVGRRVVEQEAPCWVGPPSCWLESQGCWNRLPCIRGRAPFPPLHPC